MFQKKDIETILKINGVSTSAPDEEIRSILLSARFNNDEVDTAIMVLRENVRTHETRVNGMQKVFRSDETLKPSEISSLLGIEVEVDEMATKRRLSRDLTLMQATLMIVITIGLAVASVFAAMYFYQVGIFHPTVSAFGI